jgi:hypothetical protein
MGTLSTVCCWFRHMYCINTSTAEYIQLSNTTTSVCTYSAHYTSPVFYSRPFSLCCAVLHRIIRGHERTEIGVAHMQCGLRRRTSSLSLTFVTEHFLFSCPRLIFALAVLLRFCDTPSNGEEVYTRRPDAKISTQLGGRISSLRMPKANSVTHATKN